MPHGMAASRTGTYHIFSFRSGNHRPPLRALLECPKGHPHLRRNRHAWAQEYLFLHTGHRRKATANHGRLDFWVGSRHRTALAGRAPDGSDFKAPLMLEKGIWEKMARTQVEKHLPVGNAVIVASAGCNLLSTNRSRGRNSGRIHRSLRGDLEGWMS